VDGYAEALQVLFAPQPARVEGHATARAVAEAE
jgi:hypothetical protein